MRSNVVAISKIWTNKKKLEELIFENCRFSSTFLENSYSTFYNENALTVNHVIIGEYTVSTC